MMPISGLGGRGFRPPSVGAPDGGRQSGGGSVGLRQVLGSFHSGGDVKKDGVYELEKGEKVIAAEGKRDSEYRRVYLNRKKKNEGDGKK